LIFDAKIRRDITVSRAVLKGQTVFEFDPESRAAKDYKILTSEFMNLWSALSSGKSSIKENHAKISD